MELIEGLAGSWLARARRRGARCSGVPRRGARAGGGARARAGAPRLQAGERAGRRRRAGAGCPTSAWRGAVERRPRRPRATGEPPARAHGGGHGSGRRAYMAPEQHRGGAAAARADQFASAWRCTRRSTATAPFSGAIHAAVRQHVLGGRSRAAAARAAVPRGSAACARPARRRSRRAPPLERDPLAELARATRAPGRRRSCRGDGGRRRSGRAGLARARPRCPRGAPPSSWPGCGTTA